MISVRGYFLSNEFPITQTAIYTLILCLPQYFFWQVSYGFCNSAAESEMWWPLTMQRVENMEIHVASMLLF